MATKTVSKRTVTKTTTVKLTVRVVGQTNS